MQDLNGIESTKDEMLKTSIMNMAEQEERRMSDLSDFCWSVTSSVDIQVLELLNSLIYPRCSIIMSMGNRDIKLD